MSHSISETGHYKNITNFNSLLIFCEELGTKYQPSRAELDLAQLRDKYTQAVDVVDRLTTLQIEIAKATDSRTLVFAELPKLATRIINTLEASKSSAEGLKYAHHYVSKLRGKRITPVATAPATTEGAENAKTISVRQTGYDALLDHFDHLVRIAIAEAAYQPNETDITVAALRTKVQQLSLLNSTIAKLLSRQKLLMTERQEMLYADGSGLTYLAKKVKQYMKGAFSASSAEAKKVAGISFTKVRA